VTPASVAQTMSDGESAYCRKGSPGLQPFQPFTFVAD
jgi:hypothetical protein